jgi:condensin complex subunit 1
MVLPEGMINANDKQQQENENNDNEDEGDVSIMDVDENGDPLTLSSKPSSNENENGDGDVAPVEMEMVAEETQPRLLDPETANEYMKLQLLQRYYTDAIRFARQIDEAIPTLCQLLASTSKTEVIDTMEFFVTAHYYKIASAQVMNIISLYTLNNSFFYIVH